MENLKVIAFLLLIALTVSTKGKEEEKTDYQSILRDSKYFIFIARSFFSRKSLPILQTDSHCC
jgi:hypothetical protein